MAVRQNSKVLARYSISARISQSEIEVFGTQNRILAFENREGKMEIFYNNDYVYRLRQRITETVKFYSLFTIVEGIFIDISRLKGLFEIDKDKSYIYLGESLNNVDMKINALESEIERVKKDLSALEEEKIRRQTTVTAVAYNDSQMKETAQGMTSQNKARTIIDGARLKEMLEAKEKAKLLSEKDVFPENVKLLHQQKTVLLSDMKDKLEKNVEDLYSKWISIEQYYQKIKAIGNPLDNEILLDLVELSTMSDNILPCLEQLHKTRMILFDLEQDVTLKDKIININYEIANKKVQIAGQEAAKPFLESLLDMINDKYRNLKAQHKTYVTNDRVDHLSICVDDINQNFHDLTTDLSGISGTILSDRSVSIHVPIRKLKYPNPKDFKQSKESKEANDILTDCKNEKDKYERESKLLETYKHELIELEKKKNSFVRERATERTALDNFYIKIAESYKSLLATKPDFSNEDFIKTFIYDVSMLNCLLSVLLKYICIAKLPGCCSCGSVPDHLAVEITATQLIKIFVKILGDAMKVKMGCCSGDDLDKLYGCKNIDLNDLLNLLLNIRVLGSLRDENGSQQKVVNKIRSESINHSLFYCLREMMSVKNIQYEYLYQVNMERTVNTIKTYEQSMMQTFYMLKYVKIFSKAGQNKLIKK